MGRRKLWVMLAALVLLATACSDEATPPTLATGTTATTAGPTTTTSSTTTSTTTTTTTAVVTTSENPDARFAEIERLVQETYLGRFRAIYERDSVALLDWVGSQSAYDDSLFAMDVAPFTAEPSQANVRTHVLEVLLDRTDCVVVLLDVDSSAFLDIVHEPDPDISIFWPRDDGRLLLAEGWQAGTPQQVWIEDCDLAIRGVTP